MLHRSSTIVSKLVKTKLSFSVCFILYQLKLTRFQGSHLDSQSVSIAQAMKAQQMLQQGRDKISSSHKFPALPPVFKKTTFRSSFNVFFLLQDIIQAREEVRRAQKLLEEKQKKEEDKLFEKFRADREKEEQKIDQEVTTEWENNLKLITKQYEEEIKRKQGKAAEQVKTDSKSIFSLQLNTFFQ